MEEMCFSVALDAARDAHDRGDAETASEQALKVLRCAVERLYCPDSGKCTEGAVQMVRVISAAVRATQVDPDVPEKVPA